MSKVMNHLKKSPGKKVIFVSVITLAVLWLLFLLLHDKESEKPPHSVGEKLSSTLGVSIHELEWNTDFPLMEQYKVQTARDALVWSIIEQDKGVYKFTDNGRINYDQFIQKFEDNNIQPFIILLYANNLYNDNKALDNEEIKQAYANWAAASAKRYKNKNIIWEIYNEPNIDHFWTPQTNSAANYVDVVKRTAPLIKKNDPSGIVVAPALSGLGDAVLPWLEEAFKQGMLDHVDAISVHPYRSSEPESVIADYEKLRKLISKYTKKNIPIISGEWGYSTVPNWNNQGSNYTVMDETQQAQYITRMALINQSENITKSIFYDWKDDGIDDTSLEHHFGLLKFDQTTPKQAGAALKILAETMGDYRFVKRIDIGNSNDYLFKYVNDKSQIAYSFWTTENEHIFNFEGDLDAKLITMLGQQTTANGENLKLSISQSPSYLLVN